MSYDVVTLRTALIITLAILLVAMIIRRYRRKIYEASVPAIAHAKLCSLEVSYHPPRLNVVVELPTKQVIRTTLLDEQHQKCHAWPEGQFGQGVHALERELPPLADGIYYLEVATATQRTVRQFRLM